MLGVNVSVYGFMCVRVVLSISVFMFLSFKCEHECICVYLNVRMSVYVCQ